VTHPFVCKASIFAACTATRSVPGATTIRLAAVVSAVEGIGTVPVGILRGALFR